MKTQTTATKAKSISSVSANPIVPRTTAAKKSVTARAKITDSEPSNKHPANVDTPPLLFTLLPDDLIRESKQARLIAQLRAAPGVTIQQMMALTGWQAHTVRGTISGVLRRKLGLNVVCEPSTESGERLYRIVNSVAIA